MSRLLALLFVFIVGFWLLPKTIPQVHKTKVTDPSLTQQSVLPRSTLISLIHIDDSTLDSTQWEQWAKSNPFSKYQPAKVQTVENSAPNPLKDYTLQGTIVGKVATLKAPNGQKLMLTLNQNFQGATLQKIESSTVQFSYQGKPFLLVRSP